jgi:integrase/recombinase XerC
MSNALTLVLPVDDGDWLDDAELIDEMLRAWRYTERSRTNARYTLARFAVWLADHGTTLTDATTAHCRAWLAERAGEVSPATLVKNWSQVRAFYLSAQRHSSDPLAGRRSPMADVVQPAAPEWTDTHACTDGEYAALVRHIGSGSVGLRDHIALSLMYRSGLRVGEVVATDLEHVDVDRRTVRVVWGKNNKPRLVPLHPETLDLLRRYLHPRRRGTAPGPLLVNVGGRRVSARLTVNAACNIVTRTARRAEVVDVSAHALRRGAVVAFYRGGGDDTAAMTIFGWSTATMPRRYLADCRAEVAQVTFDRIAEHALPRSREQRALRMAR